MKRRRRRSASGADFRPDRIVHVRAGQSARAPVLANPRAVDGLRNRLDRDLLDGGEFEAYKSGLIEEYATERLQSELLTLWLPTNAGHWRTEIGRMAAVLIAPPSAAIRPASQHPTEMPPAVSAITPPTPPATSRPTAPDLFAPYAGPTAKAPSAQASVPRGQKGYVEILPPPPEFAAETSGRDARYFELPPPLE